MFAFLSVFHRTLFPLVQCERKKNVKRHVVDRYLILWSRICGTFMVFAYAFLIAAFFIALLVVIQKVLPLNHKDIGMRCNGAPTV